MDHEQYALRQKEEETVTIKLSHYNELKVIADGIGSSDHILCNIWSRWILYTKDELVERLNKELDDKHTELDKLKNPHNYIDNNVVRRFSIREFRRWRKKFP